MRRSNSSSGPVHALRVVHQQDLHILHAVIGTSQLGRCSSDVMEVSLREANNIAAVRVLDRLAERLGMSGDAWPRGGQTV